MFRVDYFSETDTRLISSASFRAGALIQRISDFRLIDHATPQTIQIGPREHISDIGMLAHLTHSCTPNVHVDTDRMAIYALRPLFPGDELSYFYPSTEWEMTRPLACNCGAPWCIKLVAGAMHLLPTTVARYHINQHIRDLIMKLLGEPVTIGNRQLHVQRVRATVTLPSDGSFANVSLDGGSYELTQRNGFYC